MVASSVIAIRRATLDDMAPIVQLWGEMMDHHARNDPRIRLAEGALAAYRAYLGYHLLHSESCVRVAESFDGINGYCLLTICQNLPMFLPARYGYLSDLVVMQGRRREGTGRRLVQEALQWLRQRRIDSIQLQHYSFNEVGRSFWKAMGFKDYYTRMWLDIR
jgi:ribosomal protein S18 acetylase RimI-like enzyme